MHNSQFESLCPQASSSCNGFLCHIQGKRHTLVNQKRLVIRGWRPRICKISRLFPVFGYFLRNDVNYGCSLTTKTRKKCIYWGKTRKERGRKKQNCPCIFFFNTFFRFFTMPFFAFFLILDMDCYNIWFFSKQKLLNRSYSWFSDYDSTIFLHKHLVL